MSEQRKLNPALMAGALLGCLTAMALTGLEMTETIPPLFALLAEALVFLFLLALFSGARTGGSSHVDASVLHHIAENIEAEIAASIRDIRGLTDGVSRDSERLLHLSHHTSEASVAGASAATEAMSSSETVSSAVQEMHASIAEIAHQATQSQAIARRAVSRAEEVSALVASLHHATKTVDDIVEIISGIASRTDLLALNAAIEAARAGGAGKGFSVVAGEVKRLANLTQDSTADIAARIDDMRAASNQVEKAIEAVVAVINEVELAASSISSAAEEQSAATSEIARAVADVSTASTGVARLMEGVAGDAVGVQDLAEEVRQDCGRMTESIAGLGRALSRVAYTAHPRIDRRGVGRHSTVQSCSLTVAGRNYTGTISEVGKQGCSILLEGAHDLTRGDALEISCSDFQRRRRGRLVNLEGQTIHVELLAEDAFEDAHLEDMARRGSLLVLEKAKSDHRAFVDNIRAVLAEEKSQKASDLANHHTCRLGKWYDRVNDSRMLSNSSYRALVGPHKKVHEAGKLAVQKHHAGDKAGANAAFQHLLSASEEVIALLDRLKDE